MKVKVWPAIFAMLFSFGAIAQENSFSLLQAQDYAVTNYYGVQSASLEVQKSKKILWENISRGLPQINTAGNWTKNINLQTFVVEDPVSGELAPLTFGTPYQAYGSITGEQLIFDGSYIVAVMAADVLKENSINELEKSEIDVKEQVAKSYHLVLVSDKTIEIIEDNLKYVKQNYQESKRMFEVGFMEEQDVDQLELIVSNLENNLVFAKKQSEIARMLLKFNMGIPVENEVILTDDIESLMLFSQDGGNLLDEQFNLEENIDYRILLTQEEGQTLNVKNENVQYLPKVKFNYLYNHNIFNANANVFQGEMGVERADNIQQNLAINVTLPIFTGGGRNARVQQAKISLDQVEIAKQQTADNLKVQHQTIKAEYEYALNSYFTQKRNVEISKKIRDVSAKKLAEGMVSSLEYTQAENQYQEALRSVIDAANNVLDKKVQLEKILGNYNKVRQD
ncbi:MAG: TolC family protein [Schleiferiaceae bacterium]|jgi:outer membrane protein TolC|nr:TolC family protein [Schleiferiaceae bacterium]